MGVIGISVILITLGKDHGLKKNALIYPSLPLKLEKPLKYSSERSKSLFKISACLFSFWAFLFSEL